MKMNKPVEDRTDKKKKETSAKIIITVKQIQMLTHTNTQLLGERKKKNAQARHYKTNRQTKQKKRKKKKTHRSNQIKQIIKKLQNTTYYLAWAICWAQDLPYVCYLYTEEIQLMYSL